MYYDVICYGSRNGIFQLIIITIFLLVARNIVWVPVRTTMTLGVLGPK